MQRVRMNVDEVTIEETVLNSFLQLFFQLVYFLRGLALSRLGVCTLAHRVSSSFIICLLCASQSTNFLQFGTENQQPKRDCDQNQIRNWLFFVLCFKLRLRCAKTIPTTT